MRIIKTPITDLLIIEPQIFEDERGYFFESYNQKKFKNNNLIFNFVQDNESRSTYGVIRGLHFQEAPYEQTKLIRATTGEILDVAVDIRKNSPTFGQYFSVVLSSTNKRQLLIPKGFAHGFSVLSPEAVINYKCDNTYNKDAEKGVIYTDKEINIDWKILPNEAIISEKDKLLGTFKQYKEKSMEKIKKINQTLKYL